MATLAGTIVTNTSTDITTVPSYQSTPTVVVSGSTLIFTHSMWQYGTLSSTSQALHYASTSSAGSWSAVGTVGPEVSGLAPLSGGGFAFGYSNGSTNTGGALGYFTSVPPSSVSTESRWTANPDGSVNVMHAPLAITVGSNVALVYGGPQRSSMGSGYGQVWLQQRTGTNTYAAAELVTDAANIDYSGAIFSYGLSNGRAFFIVSESNTSNKYVRYRTSSGTYNTPSGLSIGVLRVSSGVVTGGTTINVLIVNGTNSAYLTTVDGSTDTPTVNVDSTYIALPTGTISDVALGVDSSNDKLYALVRNNANGVYLYTKAPGDSAWSSAYQVYSGATSYPVSNPVIYTNGSSQKVMGFAVVTDSGSGTTVRWYEEVLASAPSTPTTAPTVTAGVEKVTVTTPALASSTNAVAWNIYRDGTLVASGIGGSTAYDDTSASVTASQTYTVRGTSSGGTSADSPASSSVVATPGIAAFTLATVGANTVRVSITRRAYAAVYRVYRGAGGGARSLVHASASQIASGTYTWDDTSATDLQPWDYTVIVQVDTPTVRDGAESTVQTIAPNLWSSKTGITTARQLAVCFPTSAGFIGGAGFGSTNWLDTFYEYSISGNSWTAKNSDTHQFYGTHTVTLDNGDVYQLPRDGQGTTVYKYNTATDAWDTVAVATPANGSGHTYTHIGQTIYALTKPPASQIASNHFYKWTPGDASWTLLTYPNGTYSGSQDDAWFCCAGDDGYIYAQISKGASATSDEMQRYNPATDSWTTLSAACPSLYSSGGPWRSHSINWSGRIYVLGVCTNTSGGTDLSQVILWAYDYYADSWGVISTSVPNAGSSGYHFQDISGVLIESEPAIYWVGGKNSQLSSWTSANRRQGLPAYTPPPENYAGSGGLAGTGTLGLTGQLVTDFTGGIGLTGSGTLTAERVRFYSYGFEPGALDGWNEAGGSQSISTTSPHQGVYCATWGVGLALRRTFTGLIPGNSYTFQGWYASTTSGGIQVDVVGQPAQPGFAVTAETWRQFTLTFTATDTSHTCRIISNTAGVPRADDITLDDLGVLPNAGFAGIGSLTAQGPKLGSATLSGAGSLSGLAAILLLPPTNLTVTPVSPTQLDLSWDAALSATGYDIERDGAVIVENHPSTSYSDVGLVEGSAYTYRVRSVKIVTD